jgi:hypothetical protein
MPFLLRIVLFALHNKVGMFATVVINPSRVQDVVGVGLASGANVSFAPHLDLFFRPVAEMPIDETFSLFFQRGTGDVPIRTDTIREKTRVIPLEQV